MKKRRQIRELLGFFVVSLISLTIVVIAIVTQTINKTNSIPKMEITLNGTTLSEIYENGKDIKYEGNSILIQDGNDELVFSDVQIKGRGNSTWAESKKPFRIKFAKKVDLFGLGETKKWALLTNMVDNSMMRNDVSFYLNKMINEKYVFDGQYVELIMDGEDLGVYYLTKAMDINKSVVDLKDEMGLLVELDDVYCELEENAYHSKSGDCVTANKYVNDDYSEIAIEDFLDSFDELSHEAKKGDYEAVSRIADIQSFVDYYLISELTNNPDAYSRSWWFYKDGIEDKIHVGPAWDFDLALGNRNWIIVSDKDENLYDPTLLHTRREHAFSVGEERSGTVSKLMYYLLDMQEFRTEVERAYQERLSGKSDEVVSYIREQADYLREAAVKDAEMWEKGDFDEEVEYLIWWVENRFRMMDAEYGGEMIVPINSAEI